MVLGLRIGSRKTRRGKQMDLDRKIDQTNEVLLRNLYCQDVSHDDFMTNQMSQVKRESGATEDLRW